MCTATDKSGNLAKSLFSVIVKTPKGSTSNADNGISRILENITNQQQPSEFTVSDNITDVPQPTPSVIENETSPSPPNLSDEILNMSKILIDDLK